MCQFLDWAQRHDGEFTLAWVFHSMLCGHVEGSQHFLYILHWVRNEAEWTPTSGIPISRCVSFFAHNPSPHAGYSLIMTIRKSSHRFNIFMSKIDFLMMGWNYLMGREGTFNEAENLEVNMPILRKSSSTPYWLPSCSLPQSVFFYFPPFLDLLTLSSSLLG